MMHTVHYRYLNYALLLFFFVLLVGCAASPLNPDTRDDLAKVDTIAIIPSEIFVGLSKFSADNERLTDKEAEHAPVIEEFCKASIQSNGYELIEFDFEAATQDDDDFAYAISKFKEDVNTAVAQSVAWSPVGESARELARQIGADALLFVDYKGIRKSGGEVAKDIGTSILVGILTMGSVVPVAAANAGASSAFLVDGISGEVLWKNSAAGTENPIVVRNSLMKFPNKHEK